MIPSRKQQTHHVLGEGLGKAWVVALLNKVPESEGVLVGVSRGESLVCHIEEGVVLASLDGVADLLPLFRSRVDTGGVVGACMQ